MDNGTNMGKLSVSLQKEDEDLLRYLAKDNRRTISGQISYMLKKERKLLKEKS